MNMLAPLTHWRTLCSRQDLVANSGVVALVAVNDGRASVAVGVSDGLGLSAVDLVKTAVAVLGGQGGGGRPDMAQGGGPDGTKGAEAIAAVRAALAEAKVKA